MGFFNKLKSALGYSDSDYDEDDDFVGSSVRSRHNDGLTDLNRGCADRDVVARMKLNGSAGHGNGSQRKKIRVKNFPSNS